MSRPVLEALDRSYAQVDRVRRALLLCPERPRRREGRVLRQLELQEKILLATIATLEARLEREPR